MSKQKQPKTNLERVAENAARIAERERVSALKGMYKLLHRAAHDIALDATTQHENYPYAIDVSRALNRFTEDGADHVGEQQLRRLEHDLEQIGYTLQLEPDNDRLDVTLIGVVASADTTFEDPVHDFRNLANSVSLPHMAVADWQTTSAHEERFMAACRHYAAKHRARAIYHACRQLAFTNERSIVVPEGMQKRWEQFLFDLCMKLDDTNADWVKPEHVREFETIAHVNGFRLETRMHEHQNDKTGAAVLVKAIIYETRIGLSPEE